MEIWRGDFAVLKEADYRNATFQALSSGIGFLSFSQLMEMGCLWGYFKQHATRDMFATFQPFVRVLKKICTWCYQGQVFPSFNHLWGYLKKYVPDVIKDRFFYLSTICENILNSICLASSGIGFPPFHHLWGYFKQYVHDVIGDRFSTFPPFVRVF